MKLPAFAQISAVFLVAAGCATAAPGASLLPTASLAPTAVATPTVVAPSDEPTVLDTDAPATPEPRPTAKADVPPAAALGTSDFAVTGKLGSYCWIGSGRAECVDTAGAYKQTSPELSVLNDDGLIFSMEDGQFASWTAYYGDDGMMSPTTLESGGEPVDPDASQPPSEPLTFAEFDAPPVGDWVVEVAVRFADGGDAAYAWHIIVE